MSWSLQDKLEYLLRLPWTVVRDSTPEGDRLLRVKELPAAVGTGQTNAELELDFWSSLRSTIEAYLHFGDPIPLPRPMILPWLKADSKRVRATVRIRPSPDQADLVIDPDATASASEGLAAQGQLV